MEISQRTKNLGTEQVFVVLADIHFGQRIKGEGQHIRLFLPPQPKTSRKD